jgi:hypothetical protein
VKLAPVKPPNPGKATALLALHCCSPSRQLYQSDFDEGVHLTPLAGVTFMLTQALRRFGLNTERYSLKYVGFVLACLLAWLALRMDDFLATATLSMNEVNTVAIKIKQRIVGAIMDSNLQGDDDRWLFSLMIRNNEMGASASNL